MLKRSPEINENIRALQDGYWDEDWGDQYQTIGKTYRIAGNSEMNGNPYFIDDTGQTLYIDESAWFLYELVEE